MAIRTKHHFFARMTLLAVFSPFFVTCLAIRSSAQGDDPLPEHLQQLLEKLHERDTTLQIAAAKELGRLRDDRVASNVNDTIAFANEPVRRACVTALRKIEGTATATSARAERIEMTEELRCLTVDLGSKYPAIRAISAYQIGDMKQNAVPAVPFLIDALIDNELDADYADLGDPVWRMAQQALAKIGKPAASELIKQLSNDNALMRARVAALFSMIEVPESVEPLITALIDEEYDVRMASIKSLGFQKSEAAIRPIVAAVDKDPGRWLSDCAATALRNIGPAATDSIIGLAQHENKDVREGAVSRLAGIKDDCAIDALIGALLEDHIHVQGEASQHVDWIRDQRGFAPLVEGWKKKSVYHETRALILRELKDHPDELQFLTEGAADLSGEVQRVAVVRLREFPVDVASGPLISCLENSTDSWGRAAAAEALGDLKANAAVPALLLALKDPDSIVANDAASALGKIGDDRAIEPLIKALADEKLVWSAAYALTRFDDPRVFPTIVSLLHRPESSVREKGCWALAHVNSPEATSALCRTMAEDGERSVRERAAHVLGEKKDVMAVEPLIEALEDDDDSVRRAAAESLAKIGDPRAIDPLIETWHQYSLDKSEQSYRMMASSVARFDVPLILPPILELLDHPRPGVRRFGCELLGRLRQLNESDARVFDSLVASLADVHGSVRAQAASALDRLGDNRAITHLEDCLADLDQDVRKYAERALKKIAAARKAE